MRLLSTSAPATPPAAGATAGLAASSPMKVKKSVVFTLQERVGAKKEPLTKAGRSGVHGKVLSVKTKLARTMVKAFPRARRGSPPLAPARGSPGNPIDFVLETIWDYEK